MDNYIIYRKVLVLEKNKEAALRIPIIFNPAKSEFIIETNELAAGQHSEIELCFKDPAISTEIELVTLKVKLNGSVTHFKPAQEYDLKEKNLLFYAVRSTGSFTVAVSVRELVNQPLL